MDLPLEFWRRFPRRERLGHLPPLRERGKSKRFREHRGFAGKRCNGTTDRAHLRRHCSRGGPARLARLASAPAPYPGGQSRSCSVVNRAGGGPVRCVCLGPNQDRNPGPIFRRRRSGGTRFRGGYIEEPDYAEAIRQVASGGDAASRKTPPKSTLAILTPCASCRLTIFPGLARHICALCKPGCERAAGRQRRKSRI